MKTTTKFLAVGGILAALPVIYLLVEYLDREGIIEFRHRSSVNYYYPADLQALKLPRWNPTNAAPLSPDAAVRSAMRFASEKHPGIRNWEVDRISLEKEGGDGIWIYNVDLIDRQSGNYVTEYPRVLMDGTIWKPTTEERKR